MNATTIARAAVSMMVVATAALFLSPLFGTPRSPADDGAAAGGPDVGGGGLAARYLELAERRAVHLDRLHAYAERGTFPANLDFYERTPYFVDAAGTRCAVGELMHADGLGEVVAAIAKADNQVRVADVKDGALIDWVLRSGLTQAECALIQPTYEHLERERKRKLEEERLRIQAHLLSVEERLRVDSPRSLATALRRLLPHIRDELPDAAVGFEVEGPLRSDRFAGHRLVNRGTVPLRVRAVFVDRRGDAVGADRWVTLGPGSEHRVAQPDGEAWILYEWAADEELDRRPVRLVPVAG